MILISYRHGLRVGELCALTWDQVDFGQGLLHVTRLKHGVPSVHPLGGEELRALRRLRREQPEGRYLFQTERDAPMTPAGFRKTLARIGEASPLAFPVHPHMLRHACGFKLANDGQDTRALQHYLGHRNIRLSPEREAAVRAALGAGTGIRKTARLVWTATPKSPAADCGITAGRTGHTTIRLLGTTLLNLRLGQAQ